MEKVDGTHAKGEDRMLAHGGSVDWDSGIVSHRERNRVIVNDGSPAGIPGIRMRVAVRLAVA